MWSSIQRFILTVWGVMLSLVFVPGLVWAQTARVVADIPSCREYAEPTNEIVLSTPTEVPALLAYSWNGGSREQGDDYLNRGVPFPSPVLANGLPTRLDRRGIGPRNWLHPATDNAFRCEFQRNGSSSACRSHHSNAPEGSFISLVDLLSANPVNRIQATVTVTEEFTRLATDVLPPVLFPQAQTLRRAPNQAGVPAGSVRWVYTASAGLTPNCTHRPVDTAGQPVSNAALFLNGVPTLLGRAYLAQACTPVNATTLESLYGWHPVQRYAGSNLSVAFKIRALPGRVFIPRSTAFRSIAERACLALPQVVTEGNVRREELTALNRELLAATLPGLVPADLREAASEASARIDHVLEKPTWDDLEKVNLANHDRDVARAGQAEQHDRALGFAAESGNRGRQRNGIAVIALLLLVVIGWLAIRDGEKAREIKSLKQDKADHELRLSTLDGIVTLQDQNARTLRATVGTQLSCASLLKDADAITASLEGRKTENGSEDEYPALVERLKYSHLLMQVVTVLFNAPDPNGKQLAGNEAKMGFLRLSATHLSAPTPAGGVSRGGSEAAHAFMRAVTGFLFVDHSAAEQHPQGLDMMTRLSQLGTGASSEDWSTFTSDTMTVLASQRRELTLRWNLMEYASKIMNKWSGQKQQPWGMVQTNLGVLADLLKVPDEELMTDDRFETFERIVRERAHERQAAGGNRSGKHRGTPPRGAPPSRPA